MYPDLLSKRHLLASALIFFLLIFSSVAIVAAKIQSDGVDEIRIRQDNPHRIPGHVNPQSQTLHQEIRLIQVEINQAETDAVDTVHSIAFRDRTNLFSQPILDYATGTSN